MKRTLLPALLITLASAGAATAAPQADKSVARHLDKLGYTYEVDEDGDYRMVFDVEGDRTRWSTCARRWKTSAATTSRDLVTGLQRQDQAVPGGRGQPPAGRSQDAKMGGWVKQGHTAMFVVKIDADATADQLSDAIDAAIRTADAMELELTKKDEF